MCVCVHLCEPVFVLAHICVCAESGTACCPVKVNIYTDKLIKIV